MRAVLIAATLAAIAAPAYAGLETRVLGRPDFGTPANCQVLVQKTADQFGGKFKRLDELPWGLVEHAVLRSVGGCPVREVVYQGQTYWVQQQAAVGFERVQPLTRQTAPARK